MTRYVLILLAFVGCLGLPARAPRRTRISSSTKGRSGPGRGKHIVLLAGDHEYRSEESLPALARILARHYGFKCSVFFTTNAQTGFIEPGSSNIAGLEALRTADLLVVFLRFQDFPDAEMQHIADYLDKGKPVVGFRTATHAFQIKRSDAKFLKYHWQTGDEYKGGFGRQILGETWVSHYGTNHKMSSRLLLQPDQAAHPILRGVKDVWVQSGGYMAHPIEGSQVLAKGQILNGMTAGCSAGAGQGRGRRRVDADLHRAPSGKSGRVFTTTHGASEDLLNDGFRRMAVNACLWAAGLEKSIRPDGDISFVGPYQPTTFRFGGYVKGVKPSDVAGWDTPILPKTPQ